MVALGVNKGLFIFQPSRLTILIILFRNDFL